MLENIGIKTDSPCDSPSLVVPVQNAGLFQDHVEVARALGVEGIRAWLCENGGSKAGVFCLAVQLFDIFAD